MAYIWYLAGIKSDQGLTLGTGTFDSGLPEKHHEKALKPYQKSFKCTNKLFPGLHRKDGMTFDGLQAQENKCHFRYYVVLPYASLPLSVRHNQFAMSQFAIGQFAIDCFAI